MVLTPAADVMIIRRQPGAKEVNNMERDMRSAIPGSNFGHGGPQAVAVISLAAAAAIHLAVVDEHLHEWAPFGVGFAALAVVEVVLAVALCRRPSRGAWVGVGVVSLLTVGLWTLSRTAGLPIGPELWHPEVIGRADSVATLAELVTAVAALRALTARRTGARHPRLVAALALAAAIPLTLTALAGTGSEMAASAAPSMSGALGTVMASQAPMSQHSASPLGPMAAGSMAAGSMAAGSMAGSGLDTTSCPNLGGLMPMADGMVMQPIPAGAPTPAEQAAAAALVAATKAGSQRFTTLAAAQSAGYVPATAATGKVVHWVNWSVVRSKDVLDPQHPSELIYVNSAHGPVLAGVMYLSAGPCQAGPDAAGPLFHWHAHANLCLGSTGQVVGRADAAGRCANGRAIGTSSFMLHVWTAPSLGDPLQAEVPPSAYSRIIRTGQP